MSFATSTPTSRLGAGILASALLLTGCAAKVNDTSAAASSSTPAATTAAAGSAAAGPAPAGSSSAAAGSASVKIMPVTGKCTAPVNIAMNPWVGFTADAAVVTELLETKLGCKVNQTALGAPISWQGFPTGKVDVILENWGHPDLIKKYITDDKVAVDAGPTGNIGHIGWFTTPATVKKYPDITNWENLNKYASDFATSESGGKGQLLDGDPSYQTNDAALITNLKLNFKVVYAGSEAALIEAFRNSESTGKPVIGYFYTPQWFLSEVPLVNVKLPPNTPGCDTDLKKVACDYPDLILNKVESKKFAESGSSAVALINNFNWTNDDQNLVAKYITSDKMTPSAAAKKWIAANPAKVNVWLGK